MLRQKAVMVLVAWLVLALIRAALMPGGQLEPVAAVKRGAAGALIVPSRSVVRHHRRTARKQGRQWAADCPALLAGFISAGETPVTDSSCSWPITPRNSANASQARSGFAWGWDYRFNW
jgi:hypothetical protein